MSQAQDTFWPGRYQDQVGLLTGGDIALATARQLVQEGAKIYFCDISIERAQAAADQLNGLVPGSAVVGQLDVTNEKQVSNCFDRIITKAVGVKANVATRLKRCVALNSNPVVGSQVCCRVQGLNRYCAASKSVESSLDLEVISCVISVDASRKVDLSVRS